MRRRKSARLCLLLPRLRQDWPRTCRPAANGWPKLWQGRRKAMNFRPKWEKRSRKVENDGASPRERCRSPSQRGGIPVPPRLHTAPTAQDCGGTAGNRLFSSYVILHFLRTGVAPRGKSPMACLLFVWVSAFPLFFSRCVQKREEGRALRVQSYSLPLRCSIPKCGYFFVCLLYMFTYMRDIVVVFAGFVNESRFFVGMRRFYCCMSLSSMKKSPCNNDTAISFLSLHG